MNETEKFGEHEREKEPTVAELIDTCREILGDNVEELGQFEDFADALGFAFTLLEEAGVEDSEGFLKEKGILE